MVLITLTLLVWLVSYCMCEVPQPTVVTETVGSSLDLCKQGLIQLKSVNETGQIGFDTDTADQTPTPCVLKIESCPTCQIIIEQASIQNFGFYCQTGVPRLKHHCSLGCDYLYMFDEDYVNETMRLIQTWNNTKMQFKSESSSIFIVLCHGPTNYKFALTYRTVKKEQIIQGTTSHNTKGTIQSPFFPFGYYQNFETYEFIFSSSGKAEFIILSFDDWNLDSSSAFYFEDSNINGPVYGSTSRPNVISNNNKMTVKFNTGQRIQTTDQRTSMGFKAVYTFINDRSQFRNSKTSCSGGGYLLDSVGGQIEFSKETQPQEYYDCIWVVKAQPEFNGVYLKLMKKRLPIDDTSPYSKNQIQIRSGLTSRGHLLSTIYAETSVTDYQSHVDEVGFYIRINSTISSSDLVILSYASYKNTYSTDCKHDSSLFTCNNGRCIDKKLVCDGYDHCGDNYDETHGCSYSDDSGVWDKSYQYTITIGVIVPMVISVFLIMLICLLFVMIRRCRRARLREAAGLNERLQTVSEEVSTTRRGRRRRRRHRFFGTLERDNPPTYDEAIQSPPGWYDNVAFGTTVDPTLPQPPSYTEAMENVPNPAVPSILSGRPGSPSSTDSSQSDPMSINITHDQTSSSSSEEGSPWEIGRRQPRTRQRTETSQVSNSDSENDDVQTEVSSEVRDRIRNSSATERHTDFSTTPPDPQNRTRKELQKADRHIHKQNSDKTDNKHSDKIGPGPSNCVIPDTGNKVRSSRSMELLPSMSLTLSGVCTESKTSEPPRSGRLRSGGPHSAFNGSCPALSRNLTVYGEESATTQPNPSDTYHSQVPQQHSKNRSNIINNATRHIEQQGHRERKQHSRSSEVVNTENQDAASQGDAGQGRGKGDVMVVYDGPRNSAPSLNQSPSRPNAYLFPNKAINNLETHYHGDIGNQLDINNPIQKHNEPDKTNRRETKPNQRKQDSPQNESSTIGSINSSQSRPVDRRLAHLPIINQIRRTGERSIMNNTGDSYDERRNIPGSEISKPGEKPSSADNYGNGRNRSGPNSIIPQRNISKPEQSDYHRNISRPNPACQSQLDTDKSKPGHNSRHRDQRPVSRPTESVHHGNERHRIKDNTEHPRNERNISRPDQAGQYGSPSSPGHSYYHGNRDNGFGQRHNSTTQMADPSSNAPYNTGQLYERDSRPVRRERPPITMATAQVDRTTTSEPEIVNNTDGNVGYLSLNRTGGEDDDVYV